MAKQIHGVFNQKVDMDNPDLSTMAGRLKHTRLSQGLTVRELAERTGCFYTALNRLENGKTMTTCYVVHIAEALGINAHWLVFGIGDRYLDRDIVAEVAAGVNNLKQGQAK